jgi:hypothetical protein
MNRFENETVARTSANTKRSRQTRHSGAAQFCLVLVLAFTTIALCAGCGGVQGTYSDPGGAMTLQLKSGGAATVTFMGQTATCTYTTASNQVTMDCPQAGGKMVFTIQNDGSLAGPPGSFIQPLKKK